MEQEEVVSRIYLVRHGEVAWNKEATYIGRTDLPLNETGRKQAEWVADRLEREQIHAVYASDLSRARETAELIAKRFELPVKTFPELRELNYGDWEGMPEASIPLEFPEVFTAWRKDPADVRVPGGENLSELRDRAYTTFLRIADSHPDEDIVIVAHKSVNRMIICCLLEAPVGNYRQVGQGNTALNIIERRKDGSLVVETVNDCGHHQPSVSEVFSK